MSCRLNGNVNQWTKGIVANDQQTEKHYSYDDKVDVHVDEGIGEIPYVIVLIYSVIFMWFLGCHVGNSFLFLQRNNLLFLFFFGVLRVVLHLAGRVDLFSFDGCCIGDRISLDLDKLIFILLWLILRDQLFLRWIQSSKKHITSTPRWFHTFIYIYFDVWVWIILQVHMYMYMKSTKSRVGLNLLWHSTINHEIAHWFSTQYHCR